MQNSFRRIYDKLTWSLLATLLSLQVGCTTESEMPSQPVGNGDTSSLQVDLNAAARVLPTLPAPNHTMDLAYDRLPKVANSIVIGLDADMTSGSAKAGEAIRRGVVLAMEEINQQGGILGRPLELVVRDHRSNPARGVDNVKEFAAMDRVVAVVGGVHSPVVLRELDSIHRNQLVFLVPWAAATHVVSNGFTPNYVFRVSVRDEYAGRFLVEQTLKRGKKQLGLLLERTGWGRSNEKAIIAALAKYKLKPARIEWFLWETDNMDQHVERLADAGAEAIVLVANPTEGRVAIRAMAKRAPSERLPIVSHWGITASDFPDLVGPELAKVDLAFLQTYSFIKTGRPERASDFVSRYCQRFDDSTNVRQICSPVGTAHAFDLIHLLRLAIERAGTTERAAVRDALERIDQYDGLIRNYSPPFTHDQHDALDASDFCMARYAEDHAIVPVTD